MPLYLFSLVAGVIIIIGLYAWYLINARRKRVMPSLEAIEDPIIASGALLTAIAGADLQLGAKEKQVIISVLSLMTDHKKAKEAADYGTWVAKNVQDIDTVISRLCPQLDAQFSIDEKEKFLNYIDDARTAMLADLTYYIDPDVYEQYCEILKKKFGLAR